MSPETSAERVLEVLGRVPLFRGLPRSDLERIGELVTPKDIRAGEYLFREGDAGDRFFIVNDGAVELLKERPLGDHERLAVKRGGEAFGEMALLNDTARTATVRAVEDTHLLAISRLEFEELLGGESMAVRIMRGLARTLRTMDLRHTARTAPDGESFRQFGRQVLNGLEPGAAPQAEGFRVVGATARDESVAGGSLWDGLSADGGRALLAVLDVQGTGLPPAYLIAITRAVLHEVATAHELGGLLRRLNAATARNLFEGLDECVEAGLLELSGGRARWSCAGDQPAVILRADGEVETVAGNGPPLGILPHFDYDATELELGTGDTFLAFSDAPAGLIRGALDLARERRDASPEELARMLRTAFRKVQSRGAETDVSFLVVRKT